MDKKKRFEGHQVLGNNIKCDFSPDGKIVLTGSADGKVHFYDWMSSNSISVKKVHDQVCTEASYHPILPSTVATSGWDNTVAIWE